MEQRELALITGGKRIGATVAATLAARGADVALAYRGSREEAEATAAAVTALGRRALVEHGKRPGPVLLELLQDWDWDGAERELRRAVELAPESTAPHQWLGLVLDLRGRREEATRVLLRAEELDPLSMVVSALVGLHHAFGGDQYALGIHAGEDVAKAPALFAD